MISIICDYLIFFGFLIGSTLFPLWGNIMKKKKQNDQADTKANYVFASGQVGIFAMVKIFLFFFLNFSKSKKKTD